MLTALWFVCTVHGGTGPVLSVNCSSKLRDRASKNPLPAISPYCRMKYCRNGMLGQVYVLQWFTYQNLETNGQSVHDQLCCHFGQWPDHFFIERCSQFSSVISAEHSHPVSAHMSSRPAIAGPWLMFSNKPIYFINIPLLVRITAPGCPAHQAEIPTLPKKHRTYHADGLSPILSITATGNNLAEMKALGCCVQLDA